MSRDLRALMDAVRLALVAVATGDRSADWRVDDVRILSERYVQHKQRSDR